MANPRSGGNTHRIIPRRGLKLIEPSDFAGLRKVDFSPRYLEETLGRARQDYAKFAAEQISWLEGDLMLLAIALKKLRIPRASIARSSEDVAAMQQGATLGAGVIRAAIEDESFAREWCNGNLMQWDVAERGLDCGEYAYEEDISRVYSDRVTAEFMEIGTDAARTACFMTVSVALVAN